MNNLEGGDKIVTDNNGAKVRYGINQAANPDVDLNKLTPESAEQIYKDRYWNKIDGDKLPTDMQLPAIAFAANAGPARAKKLIAESDGDVDKFLDLQQQYYENLGSKPKYADQLQGWMNRLDKVKAANGKQYASADTGTQTDAQYDNNTPDLPPGFQLDTAATGSADLPPGFELDTQASDLPGLAGVPNVGQPDAAPPITSPDTGPQVPIYGADGVTPIPPKAASPTDSLMLAGQAPGPDFLERSAADWKARNEQAADINQHDYSGPGGQSIVDTLTQNAGNVAGRFIGDPIMNALGSAGRYFHTGDIGDDNNPNNTTLTDIVKGTPSAVADVVSPYANPGFKEAGDFVKSSPLLQRNLSAANDLAIAAPFLKPAGELLGAADSGVTKGLAAITPAADADVTSRNIFTNESGVRRGDDGPGGGAGPIPTAEEMRANASKTYKLLDPDAQALDAPSVDKFISGMTELAPQTRAGKIVAGDSPLTKIVDNIAGEVDPKTGERTGGLGGQPLTMAEAQEVDEALGDHIDNLTDTTTGRLTKQGKKLQDVQTAFRKAVIQGGTEGGDQLALARAQWAQAARMNDVERINVRAELMQNPITARQTGYRNLYRKLQQSPMGWTPQEIALVKRAADSGVVTDLFRVMGSRLGPIGAGVAGTAMGGPLGGAMAFGTESAIAGTARTLANKIHLGRDTAVKRAIAERPMPIVRPAAVAAAEVAEAVPESQAARNGADSNSGNLSTSLEGKPGKPISSPKDNLALGTQTLEDGSNSTSLAEPSGILSAAQNLPESYRGPVANRADDINTPIDTSSIYHNINDKSTLLDKAKENLEPTLGLLRDATQDIPGAKVIGSRIKDPETLDLKIDRKGIQPNQISDYLGSRIQIDSNTTADQVIKNIGKNAKITHEDNFMSGTGRPDTGYRAIHLQVMGKDGFSHEVQIIPKEIMDIYDKNRALYDKWKDYRGNVPPEMEKERQKDMATAKKLFDDAWARYESRNRGLIQRPPIEIQAQGRADTAITPTGDEIKVRHAVVEGRDLIASQHDDMTHNADYPQVLQPRDRSTFASHQQVTNLAHTLNPRLLMDNPLTSEGAPIVSKDGVVESGNGRVLAIRKAFTENPQGADKYRQALQDAGYNVDKVKNPVLVRIRETPMTDDQRIKLTQDSNVRTTAAMSSVEQAAKDATRLSPETLERFRGGDIKLLRNRDFVKSAIKDMVPESEQASVLAKDGGLSQEAERRINNALLTKAYGDENITRLLTENTDNDLTTLGRALTHVAPVWAKMREAVKSGQIPVAMDITPIITDATKLILRARKGGESLPEILGTDDMLNPVSQDIRDFVNFVHQNNKLTKFISHDKIVDALSDYANEAQKTQAGVNLFGEEPLKPSEILDNSYKKARGDNKDEQTKLFGSEDETSGSDVR